MLLLTVVILVDEEFLEKYSKEFVRSAIDK
jgi:hypothetical protein